MKMRPKANSTLAIFIALLIALSLGVWINGTATESSHVSTNKEHQSAMKEIDSTPCWPAHIPLPNNVRILAAGAYAGRELNVQIDSSGHAATQIDVVVNVPDVPVFLMLGAYEPAVWTIAWTEGSKVLGVLVSGNHRQVVAGLPASIPLIESSLENQYRCGSFYVAENRVHELNPVARKVFGRPVDMVYLAQDGKVVIGTELTPQTVVVHKSSINLDTLRVPGTLLAGSAGLLEAERLGLLRKATATDAQLWTKAYLKNQPKRDDPPVSGKSTEQQVNTTLHNAYVVLEEFTYPAGLYSGDLATFYIPPGVPTPKGNPGHSTVFDMTTGTCVGAMC